MQGYYGEIRLFAGTYAPRFWLYCEGQVLRINENQVLFSLLGTTYGGDGRSTFALPRLADLVPGVKYIVCINGVYPQRHE